MDSNNNNILAFIGGFIGAMTHYITSIHILLNLQMEEIQDFTVHSLIGGAIMVVIKVIGDWIIHFVTKYKPKQ